MDKKLLMVHMPGYVACSADSSYPDPGPFTGDPSGFHISPFCQCEGMPGILLHQQDGKSVYIDVEMVLKSSATMRGASPSEGSSIIEAPPDGCHLLLDAGKGVGSLFLSRLYGG